MIEVCRKSILFLTTFVFTCTGLAATIRVPSDMPTIQAGIDAASNGDTVLLADGTYNGEGNCNIDIDGKSLIIRSENGAGECVIDCVFQARGFHLHSETLMSSEIRGLTISRCYSDQGAGILSDNCDLRIDSCVISGNRASKGGGIYCTGNGSLTVLTSSVSDNSAGIGGGIYCKGVIPASIDSTEISGNSSHGVCCEDGSSLTISNSTISVNGGRGLICFNNLSADRCRVSANRDGGIDCRGFVSITNSTIENNHSESGAGIRCSESNVIITNCTISDNHADDSDFSVGGGIYCSTMSSMEMTNCCMISNRSWRGGAIYAELFSTVDLTNCTLAANKSATYGGACYWFFSGVNLLNCISWNNLPDGFCGYDLNAAYSNIQGGHPGIGNTDTDPLFIGGYPFDYHLSMQSPCIDTGTDCNAPDIDIDYNIRPMGATYDMGAYEFPGFPSRTSVCISMPSHMFHTGDTASCSVSVWNSGNDLPPDTKLFVVLDVFGGMFCAPGFIAFDYYTRTFPNTLTELTVLPEFSWPGGCGSASGMMWYAALLDPGMTTLLSPISVFDFGWEE